MKKKQQGPRILVLDIETFGLVVETWGIWQQVITPDQIIKDWCLASWAAKFIGEEKVMYMDNRNRKDPRDDKQIVMGMHKLLNSTDIIVTQNGKSFDIKKLNARFAFYNLPPTSHVKHFDTKQVSKRKFGFTSNSLKELCKYLHIKFQKSEHKKFPGRDLWRQCEAKNLDAWKEMQKYNILDVLATEEVYKKLEPWDNSINHNVYREDCDIICNCGSKQFKQNGHAYTEVGKFKRYKCKKCGKEAKSSINLFSVEKKKSLLRKVK